MAQFQVYRNPRPSRLRVPFLLDVQSDIVSIGMRWVIPLVEESAFGPSMTRINPAFIVDGQRVVMATAEIGGVPLRDLREPVANLASQRRDILAAIDFILNG